MSAAAFDDTLGRPGTGSAGRAEILDAAARSFMEHGFNAATIDDVADRINATKGRVYHYYRSKIALFLDVHLMAMAILFEAVRPVSEGGAPAERLYAMSHRHAHAIMEHFAYQKVSVLGPERPLISGQAARPNATLERVIRLRDEYEAIFASVLEDGMAEGSFVAGPPRVMTKPVLGALNWLTLWYRPELSADAASRDRIADTLAGFVVRGVLKGGDAG